MPYLQAMNNMAVPVDLPVGETIPGTVRNYTFSGRCVAARNRLIYPGAPIISCYYGSGREVSSGVYSTGVAGIGIRLRNSRGQPMANAVGGGCDTRAAALGYLTANLSYTVSVSVEFVKTGTVGRGNLDSAQTRFGFGVYNSGIGLGGPPGNYIGFSGSATPRQIICRRTAPSTVALPPVLASRLSRRGTTAGTTPFSIGLTCDGAAAVGITFDVAQGTPISSAATGVIGIQNAGTAGRARGVGLQLIDAGTSAPVPLQTRNPLGNIAANVPATYRYAVRYYSLADSPTPGSVNGAMIFTFDYR
jgi:type 1 fimbria pilin